jgi:nucleoid DNA-binding protein
MNQSQLIEKVARATELSQATAGQAVKAAVNAILDSLVAERRSVSPASAL